MHDGILLLAPDASGVLIVAAGPRESGIGFDALNASAPSFARIDSNGKLEKRQMPESSKDALRSSRMFPSRKTRALTWLRARASRQNHPVGGMPALMLADFLSRSCGGAVRTSCAILVFVSCASAATTRAGATHDLDDGTRKNAVLAVARESSPGLRRGGQATVVLNFSPSVFESSMKRAASSSSGHTTPGFVLPSATWSVPTAAA